MLVRLVQFILVYTVYLICCLLQRLLASDEETSKGIIQEICFLVSLSVLKNTQVTVHMTDTIIKLKPYTISTCLPIQGFMQDQMFASHTFLVDTMMMTMSCMLTDTYKSVETVFYDLKHT